MYGVRSQDSIGIGGSGSSWRRVQGGLLGPGNVLSFDLGAGYMAVSSVTKLTEL